MKSKIKGWLLPTLAIVLTCLFPCLFFYFQNAGEASLHEILPVLALFLGCAALLCAGCWLLLRDAARAAVLTIAAMLVGMNFTGIGRMFQKITLAVPLRVLLLALVLLLAAIALLLYKKKPDMRPICRIAVITFAGLIAVNFALNAGTIIRKLSYRPKASAGETGWTFTKQDTPNVYFLIFDEYGGQNCLKHYFDDGNETFLNALEARGFSVSNDSHNPESVHTDTLIPNLLNLDYVVNDGMEIAMRLEHLRQPALYRIFEENGYQVNLVNHYDFLKEDGVTVLYNSGKETVTDIALKNSIFGQFSFCDRLLDWLKGGSRGKKQTGRVEADNILSALDAAANSWQSAQGQKTFTICYFQLPHTGFYFREDGSLLPEDAANDWMDKSNYLGQLRFTNHKIEEIVGQIQAHDPQAVIVLQSDHGARYACKYAQTYQLNVDYATESPYMCNILNCVYAGGEKLSISGLTGINTWVEILNTVFGAQLAPRAVPDFTSSQ